MCPAGGAPTDQHLGRLVTGLMEFRDEKGMAYGDVHGHGLRGGGNGDPKCDWVDALEPRCKSRCQGDPRQERLRRAHGGLMVGCVQTLVRCGSSSSPIPHLPETPLDIFEMLKALDSRC